MWNRKTNYEVAAMKYGKNKSRTLAGLVSGGNDVEMVVNIEKNFLSARVQEDANSRILRPRKTGSIVYKRRDDETDIFY